MEISPDKNHHDNKGSRKVDDGTSCIFTISNNVSDFEKNHVDVPSDISKYLAREREKDETAEKDRTRMWTQV